MGAGVDNSSSQRWNVATKTREALGRGGPHGLLTGAVGADHRPITSTLRLSLVVGGVQGGPRDVRLMGAGRHHKKDLPGQQVSGHRRPRR